MANERLGQQVEVTFHIQEGSFYNCIMPGFAPFLYIFFFPLKRYNSKVARYYYPLNMLPSMPFGPNHVH